MKVLILIIFTSLLLFSCGDNNSTTEAQQKTQTISPTGGSFTIDGKIDGATGMIIYLEAFTSRGPMEISKTSIAKDGSFSMTSNIQGYAEYYLRLGSNKQNSLPIVLLPGTKLKLNANVENYKNTASFSGTKWANNLNSFLKYFNKFADDINLLRNQNLTEYEQMKAFFEIRKDLDTYAFNLMKEEPSNPINLLLFKNVFPSFGNMIGWDSKNTPILENVASALNKDFPGSRMVSLLKNQVEQLKNEEKAVGGNFEAPEIILNNIDGKEIKLSDFKGKYVLIDFWASWCGPCRKENPHVVELYKEFKNKNFTIFSVSLDTELEKWKMAIKQDNLLWKNHVSDLKGWESSVPGMYNVSSIPHTVLINPEGKIIGQQLRGGTLEWKLREVL